MLGSVRVGAGEVAVFEAVGVAFEGEDVGVVNEPVDHGGGGDVVAEDLAPAGEGLGRFAKAAVAVYLAPILHRAADGESFAVRSLV